MKKILYHGSEVIVEKPEYGKGARANDYGRGFYCTEEIELAREWACAKGRNGYTNKYEMELDKMEILNLNSPDLTRRRLGVIRMLNSLSGLCDDEIRLYMRTMGFSFLVDFELRQRVNLPALPSCRLSASLPHNCPGL